MKFEGSYVALITPFKSNGEVDEDKIRELVNYHIENGTAGIVPCGTTGEAPTLTFAEHEKVIKIVVEEVKGRIQVIAGAGSNNTDRAVELTKYAKELGADAALSTCPYYNKPSQRGIYEHYKKIAEEAKFPVMLYNVPGRTGVNIEAETVAKLAEWMQLDGVLITEEGYGNPDTDLMMNCRKVERKGVKVVLITDEFPGKDGKSQSLADTCEEATALASCGQGNATLQFPVMDRIIGTMEYIENQIGGWAGCVNEDGSFEAEIQIIIASTIANGFNKLAARGY